MTYQTYQITFEINQIIYKYFPSNSAAGVVTYPDLPIYLLTNIYQILTKNLPKTYHINSQAKLVIFYTKNPKNWLASVNGVTVPKISNNKKE